MIYFIESVNKKVIHVTNNNLPITIGEHFICHENKREYKVNGIISNFGATDKTIVLQPVSFSHMSYKEYLQTGGV